jgi:hypothetical protein
MRYQVANDGIKFTIMKSIHGSSAALIVILSAITVGVASVWIYTLAIGVFEAIFQIICSLTFLLLQPGDSGVLNDGFHVMAYTSDGEWIEADPGKLRVVSIRSNSERVWSSMSVRVMRWNPLETINPRER